MSEFSDEDLDFVHEDFKAIDILAILDMLLKKDDQFYQIIRGILVRNKSLRELQSKIAQL